MINVFNRLNHQSNCARTAASAPHATEPLQCLSLLENKCLQFHTCIFRHALKYVCSCLKVNATWHHWPTFSLSNASNATTCLAAKLICSFIFFSLSFRFLIDTNIYTFTHSHGYNVLWNDVESATQLLARPMDK